MRKCQQKQLLELIQTLNEANAEIDRLLLSGDSGTVIKLLADSQEFAIHIGEFIEKVEGEGTDTVSLLEEYHTDLYTVSVAVSEGTAKHSLAKRLKKKVISIENNIREELKPDTIEVVFLPYKACMWDSLESIWLAARDDPRCDAYVVPIPYYEKLPNGSLGRMHYEGDLYPDYVPVVDWRKYDIEARHPDAIFIHNPYDEANHVTSVHPDFYSSRIHRFTDLLCYVPYFVVEDYVREHFCLAPGCQLAHKVVLQSKRVCNTYLSTYRKVYGNKWGKPEDKFIALGSPKFDKIINTKREDYVLPAAWRNLIGGKKVVLYNTSIGSMLQGNEQYLKKLCCVLDTFKKRDNMVLWWRPHPLSKVTYTSMRHQLLAAYEQVVAAYKRGGWGIYDDTADLHRAIAMSDLYYGDKKSSVMALYITTGKPAVVSSYELENGVLPLVDDDFTTRANTDKDVLYRNVNPDGTCGSKVYEILCASLIDPYPAKG